MIGERLTVSIQVRFSTQPGVYAADGEWRADGNPPLKRALYLKMSPGQEQDLGGFR